MDTDLIIISEYCDKCNIDPQFIIELGNDGLISIKEVEKEKYIPASELPELEKFKHLYYDLDINVPGIDAIHNMLQRIEIMQREIFLLRNQISFFKK